MARAGIVHSELTMRAEFEDFVAVNGNRLLHTAYGLCGDWQHAEDLVQHVLFVVATRWSRITTDPLAYAYRCLVRANIDRWRGLRHRREVLADPVAIATLHGNAARPATIAGEEHPALLEALWNLPVRQRSIVVLRYLQDRSEAQTAEALGISVGAVKSGASRGLARLRGTLSQSLEEIDQ